MGHGERSVRRWLRELEQAGLITIKQRGQGRPNLYTVHLKAMTPLRNTTPLPQKDR